MAESCPTPLVSPSQSEGRQNGARNLNCKVLIHDNSLQFRRARYRPCLLLDPNGVAVRSDNFNLPKPFAVGLIAPMPPAGAIATAVFKRAWLNCKPCMLPSRS